jgi:hypothetical protein
MIIKIDYQKYRLPLLAKSKALWLKIKKIKKHSALIKQG